MSDDKLNQNPGDDSQDYDVSLDNDLSLDGVINEDDLERLESGEPSEKKGNKGLLIGGGAILAVVVGGFAWIAVQVLSPTPSTSQQQAASFGNQDFGGQESSYSNQVNEGRGDGFGNQGSIEPFGGNGNLQVDPSSGVATNAWEASASIHQPAMTSVEDTFIHGGSAEGGLVNDPIKAINITSGLPMSDADDATLTDEERMYDQLLSQADHLTDVPAEAIKIDHSVINRQLDARRIGQLEETVTETRNSVAQIGGYVADVRELVSELSQMVEAGQSDTKAMAERIDKIDAAVAMLSNDRSGELTALEARIQGIERKANDAAKSAQKAASEAAKASAQAKPVVAVAAAAAPAVPAAAPARMPTAAATPARQAPEPTAPPVNKPEPRQGGLRVTTTALAPSQPVATVTAGSPDRTVVTTQDAKKAGSCDSEKVSSVWRVMGVNANSAYITRAQDRAGLLVREGTEIPGFGRAVSFDSGNRAICTTSGVIRR